MIHLLLGPFYAATISMTPDGGLLVQSARDRVLAWGMVFCIVAAASLVSWLLRIRREWSLGVFIASLLIPVFVMPSVQHERIHVLRNRITLDSSAWYGDSRSVIDLEGMQRISQDEHQFRLAGMLLEPHATWHLSRDDGTVQDLELSGFFTAHRMVVALYLRDRGRLVEMSAPESGGGPG